MTKKDQEDEKITYETDNLAIAAFFELNGLKYKNCCLGTGRNGNSIVNFVFEDSKRIGRDLERSYRNSNEKKYRELLLFFRHEIFLTNKDKRGS